MRGTKSQVVLPLLTVVVILATPAMLSADEITQPSETLPGFQAHQVYQTTPYDDVNLFSGVVSVQVPMGPVYSLSSGLDWQLAAHYSSRGWRLINYTCADGSDVTRSHAGGTSALGVGWTFELGAIEVKTIGDGLYYHTPDGAMTQFDRLSGASFCT